MTEYKQFFFSGTLVYSNIFCSSLIRACFDALFAQNKFLTEVSLAISVVHFSFTTFFSILNSSYFAHIPNLGFPKDVV